MSANPISSVMATREFLIISSIAGEMFTPAFRISVIRSLLIFGAAGEEDMPVLVHRRRDHPFGITAVA